MSSDAERELVALMLQFLEEHNLEETRHLLEKESGLFFNTKYFVDKVEAGEWEEVEKYLSGFTKFDDNKYSTKIFFEISKQKYLEALDRQDRAKATEILVTDLKRFKAYNEELYKDITQLVTFEDFREKVQLCNYGDIKTARSRILLELIKLIKLNPLIRDKYVFPSLQPSRLQTLINQSLKWQHHLCSNPEPRAVIRTLFTDHNCSLPTDHLVRLPPSHYLVAAPHNRFHVREPHNGYHVQAPPTGPLVQVSPTAPLVRMPVSFPVPVVAESSAYPSVGVHCPIPAIGQVANLKRPRTPPVTSGMVDHRSSSTDNQHLMQQLPPAQSVDENETENVGESFKKLKTMLEIMEKTKPWKLTEIQDPVQCQIGIMPDTDASSKVVRLLYTSCGGAILAVGSNGVQYMWRWPRSNPGQYEKASATVVPQLLKSDFCQFMVNDLSNVNLEEASPCLALSNNDSYVVSAFGGKVRLFSVSKLRIMATFLEFPPAPTFIAFYPWDNNVLAVGMADCTIQIFMSTTSEVKAILKFHKKPITSLAFSISLKTLVSADADTQLCAWNIDTWEKRKSATLHIASEKAATGTTRVEFHSNHIHLLVVHETQLTIYGASKMDLIRQWLPQDVLSAPISHATYSCNSKVIYAAFCDGNIGVFEADSLVLRCRIAPAAYIPDAVSKGITDLYPLTIAGNPVAPSQFAVGLGDGSVKVIEPSKPDSEWGSLPPIEGEASSSIVNNHGPE